MIYNQMLLCRYLLLCEYASTGSRGQVTIHGIFNGINAIDFPASQEPFSVTIELSALRRAVVDEELAIQIVALDEGHEETVLRSKSFRVGIEAGRTIAMTLDLGRTIFDQPGAYRVKLVADDRSLSFRDLAVRRIAQSGET